MSSETEIVQVEAMDPNKKNSEIVDTNDEGELANESTTKSAMCWYNGRQYSTGATVCSGGRRLYCNSYGSWNGAGSC
jgi:hypothetical protein